MIGGPVPQDGAHYVDVRGRDRLGQVGEIERFDRFVPIVAAACILPLGLGLRAKPDFEPSAWSTARRARDCRVFAIGKAMRHRADYMPEEPSRRVRGATIEADAKWG